MSDSASYPVYVGYNVIYVLQLYEAPTPNSGLRAHLTQEGKRG
jgi:hypothetical protein